MTQLPADVGVGRGGSWLRRGLWWFIYLLAWLIVLALAAIAVLRIFFHDGTLLLTQINAFTRYVFLPAYFCLAWAAWQRRWCLAAAAALVVACHVVWLAPDFLRDRRFDPSAAAVANAGGASPTVRIFFANVAADNTEFDSLLQEIADANPDVIVLVECTRPWYAALRSSPVMAPYVYGNAGPHPWIESVNVFSKLALSNLSPHWFTNRSVSTADVQVGAHTLRLVGLHAPRPMKPPYYDYDGYWKGALPLLAEQAGPVVIVGDFNATQHSVIYQKLKAGGLRSAHEDRGRGYATTWPNGQYLLPPIRIDQALVSPSVECVQIVEGIGRGSDHKPLILDVQIRGDRANRAAAGTNRAG